MARFFNHRIVERVGVLSGDPDFIIEWKLKGIPYWFPVKTKNFNTKKIARFDTYEAAMNELLNEIEYKKRVNITDVCKK